MSKRKSATIDFFFKKQCVEKDDKSQSLIIDTPARGGRTEPDNTGSSDQDIR